MMVSPSKEKPLWYANVPALFQDWKALNTDAPIGQPQKRLQINVPLLRALLWTPPFAPPTFILSFFISHSFASHAKYPPMGLLVIILALCFAIARHVKFRFAPSHSRVKRILLSLFRSSSCSIALSRLGAYRNEEVAFIVADLWIRLDEPLSLLLNAISISHRIVYKAAFISSPYAELFQDAFRWLIRIECLSILNTLSFV